MDNQPMQQTVNPIYVIDDEQLVSAMTLAREDGNNNRFVELRDEVMYRLRLSHIENWTKPPRIVVRKSDGSSVDEKK